jgi:hypothetical protein
LWAAVIASPVGRSAAPGGEAADRPRWLAVIRMLVRVCPVRLVRHARSRWWSAGVACSSRDKQCTMADGCASTP